MLPDQRSNKELLVGFKGAPWDMTAGAIPVRIAVPAPEVVARGAELEAALDVRSKAEGGGQLSSPVAASAEGAGGADQPALAMPASPRLPAVVHGPKGTGEEPESSPKRAAASPQQGDKRSAEEPVEAIDPEAVGSGELDNLKYYQVFRPVLRSATKGKKFITTTWEEVPKFKDGQWVVRSHFVAREFR